jgi:hypothetical protein
MFFNFNHVVGDYQNGKLYRLNLDYYSDNGDAIVRRRAAATITNDTKRQFFDSLEVEMDVGYGISTGQGSDPQICLDWSDDNGHTWSNELWVDIGATGYYQTRAKWWRLGQARDRVFRITVTDPVPVRIVAASITGRPGAN